MKLKDCLKCKNQGKFVSKSSTTSFIICHNPVCHRWTLELPDDEAIVAWNKLNTDSSSREELK